jgi:hypothetical protein
MHADWGRRRLPPFSGAATANLDAVEMALAKALTEAAAAGRFDVVAELARELEARHTLVAFLNGAAPANTQQTTYTQTSRLARAGNVVELKAGRGRRR